MTDAERIRPAVTEEERLRPRGQLTHKLKIWPEYFEEIRAGRKTFEIRRNDRDYRIGDVLELHEWSPETGQFTLSAMAAKVTYLIEGPAFGIGEGWVVMSIARYW